MVTQPLSAQIGTYGANHLTFVQGLYGIKKNPKFISSWENTFDGPERSPRGIKFRLKIEGVFFFQPIPNLRMADKSAHFTRFLLCFWPLWYQKS